MKTCTKCKEQKPPEAFSIQRGMKDGLRAYCKSCSCDAYKQYCLENPEKVKDSYYRKMYGISLVEYQELFSKQNGSCAICKKPETAHNKSLAVDHHPSKGHNRGLLCHKCNAGLGHFNDSVELMKAAIRYLNA